ncbi:spore maturation protein A [Clostridium acetireducens DSM 10703]|jgi:spore maturation protein A|uniref:Spore maturation protein A n=1 Tax=Clostridium acetireducens DSM 10703 TaxID=1121290 RepID=A0A1E8EXV7_9CLOT|nr:nucleoside recognition domain-containing protein [Clostridium acetireducens]OFI05509.1 spore maturation protein A [Clostridium acetireducens DSM 10703]
MINIIWFFILFFGLAIGFVTGKGDQISKVIVSSADSTVKLTIAMLGIMSFWCGIMKIAQKSGLTKKLSKLLNPILSFIFNNVSKSEKAMGAIIMNLTANMMGISNAATPFGIQAMKELQKLNIKKDTATDDMALFLVLNACCIQIIPTTIISIRAAMNSKNAAVFIIPTIITTGFSAIVGVICCKILQRYF